jgi:hypothetical protein
MDLAGWRDMMIVIWGAIGTLTLIFICIIVFLFYRKLSLLLNSANYIFGKVGDVMDYTDEEIIQPIIQFGAMLKGIMQGIDVFKKIFRNKEDDEV